MVAIESEAKTLSELKVEEMEARTYIYKLIPEIINDIVERELQNEKTNMTIPKPPPPSSPTNKPLLDGIIYIDRGDPRYPLYSKPPPKIEDFSSSSSTISDGSNITNISVDNVTTGTQTETGIMYVIRNQIETALRWFTCFWNFPRYIF